MQLIQQTGINAIQILKIVFFSASSHLKTGQERVTEKKRKLDEVLKITVLIVRVGNFMSLFGKLACDL